MIHQTFPIRENEQTTLTTYILDSTPYLELRPLVLICPGGGFLSCNPLEGECVALRFNREGFHAAVLCYSTRQSAPNRCGYPQHLFDLAQAVKLVRSRGAEWRVDADKMILLGFSAGGNVCALYENLWNTQLLRPQGAPEELRPNAAVLCYPMLDIRRHQNFPQESFVKMMNMAQFGKEVPEELDIQNNSPIFHINSDTPPTFLWHTFADPLLSPVQSLEYAQRLHEAGVPCELHIYQNGKHGLSLADRTSAGKAADIDEHIATWAPLALQWLKELFDL